MSFTVASKKIIFLTYQCNNNKCFVCSPQKNIKYHYHAFYRKAVNNSFLPRAYTNNHHGKRKAGCVNPSYLDLNLLVYPY